MKETEGTEELEGIEGINETEGIYWVNIENRGNEGDRGKVDGGFMGMEGIKEMEGR